MPENLIDRYYSIVSAHCDAPEVFIRASACHLVSSLLGRFFSSKNFPGRDIHGMRPNVWFIMSSIPGRTRRSTIHNCDRYVYMRTLKKIFENEENEDRKIQSSIIEEGTPEGIGDHITDTHRDLKLQQYDIQSPEFGGVLKKTKKGDYQEGLPTLLSKLYSGEGGTQLLSKRKGGSNRVREIPEGLYVTMFTGMQKPENYLSEYMITQGLLRRIMICYVPTKQITMKNWKPPGRMEVIRVYEELNEIVDCLSEKMNTYDEIYDNSNPIEVDFLPFVIRSINEVARKCDERLSGREETNLNIYQQSLWEHYAKLSMLEAIARGELRDNRLFVSNADGDRAKAFLKNIISMNETIIDSVVKSDEYKSSKKIFDKWYNYIEEGGPTGRTATEIFKKFNPLQEDFNKYILSLKKQERIYENMVRKGKRGPESKVYIATIFREDNKV